MGDRNTTRPRRLGLRSQTLRVLGHDDLQQVVGGGDTHALHVVREEQRVRSGRCLGG